MSTTGTLRLNAAETLALTRAVLERIESLDKGPAISTAAMERAQLVKLSDKLTEYAAGKGWL